LLTHFGVFRKQNKLLLIQKQLLLTHFGVFRKQNKLLLIQKQLLLTHFGVFRKQNKLLLTQTPVCLLILVFSASKISFYLFKPQFAYSFWCFPQAK
jgi:hypothetical protein